MKFDYIIAGSGCAGLSLLYRILNEPTLNGKKIAVIDRDLKSENDRTWCYWEKENGIFDEITHHSWNELIFRTEDFNTRFKLGQYQYKMIRGIDFYNFVIPFAERFENVYFINDEIVELNKNGNLAVATCKNDTYEGQFIFNSTPLFYPKMNEENTLLQHFMGWKVKFNTPAFDPEVGTLMDFSIDQKHGTTFMYVLPTDTHTALVEYTLFTEATLEEDEYRIELQKYITERLKPDEFSIEEEEFGVIPMSQAKFRTHLNERIIQIGTAGGYTKASSGYTFQFIQDHVKKITERLVMGISPLIKRSMREKMFDWYDMTLLEVLLTKSMSGKDVFSTMFRNTQADIILKFLANESTLIEDLKIMWHLPVSVFLPAGMKQLFLRK